MEENAGHRNENSRTPKDPNLTLAQPHHASLAPRLCQKIPFVSLHLLSNPLDFQENFTMG
jgi:hypothetical protein